ncbi:MAG: SecDF P1 head subdomain-containing protein [Acidimicrobiia bacterium]
MSTLDSRQAGLRYEVGPVAMTEASVKSARAEREPAVGGWIVHLALNRSGAKQLDALARRIGNKQVPENQIALVVNGVVESVPMFDGVRAYPPELVISGGVAERHAKALAATLNP